MMKTFVVMACCVFASPAVAAQNVCLPHSDLVKSLKQRHKETLKAAGRVNEQILMEMFVSDSGSFTIAMTYRSGNGFVSCIRAAGRDFKEIEQDPPGDPT